MVAQTFVSLHLYGYCTVLATIQKIFTTHGLRSRSTTRFYNRFGVDTMYMTTEDMEVQLCPRYERQLNHMAESTSPIQSLLPYALTTLIIIPQRTDGLKRTGYIDWRGRLLRTILTPFEAKECSMMPSLFRFR